MSMDGRQEGSKVLMMNDYGKRPSMRSSGENMLVDCR